MRSPYAVRRHAGRVGDHAAHRVDDQDWHEAVAHGVSATFPPAATAGQTFIGRDTVPLSWRAKRDIQASTRDPSPSSCACRRTLGMTGSSAAQPRQCGLRCAWRPWAIAPAGGRRRARPPGRPRGNRRIGAPAARRADRRRARASSPGSTGWGRSFSPPCPAAGRGCREGRRLPQDMTRHRGVAPVRRRHDAVGKGGRPLQTRPESLKLTATASPRGVVESDAAPERHLPPLKRIGAPISETG